MVHDEWSLEDKPITVKPLELKDVGQMSHWGRHDDLRYLPYNFPYTKPIDWLLWLRSKKRPFKKYIFGAFIGERLVGYITLKQINWFKREAYMGVAFDPALLGKGYGTAAIQQYLKLVTERFRLKKIFLKTACFNLRGQRCYEKAGFTVVEKRFEPFEDQSLPFELLLHYGDFQMVENEIWTEYIYMVYETGLK